MQLCCIMVGDNRYTYAFRLFVQVIFLNMVIAIMGIPIAHTLHAHTVESSQHEGDLSESIHDSGNKQSCDLCASYARFVPREASPISSFDFNAHIILLPAVFLQAPNKQPCEGLRQGHTNRGPPIGLHTV